jgi:hypothetical protein
MTEQQRSGREEFKDKSSFHKTPFLNASARATVCVLN